MDKFQPHQQRVIDKLIKTPEHGVIAYHSLGSGKTFTALGAADAILRDNPRKKALFVVPASLKTNVYDELKKHRLTKLKIKLMS
jgi:superfamily II DNA or RNA helicase